MGVGLACAGYSGGPSNLPSGGSQLEALKREVEFARRAFLVKIDDIKDTPSVFDFVRALDSLFYAMAFSIYLAGDRAGPVLIIEASHPLPQHPTGTPWRLFATFSEPATDVVVGLVKSIETRGYSITEHPLEGIASRRPLEVTVGSGHALLRWRNAACPRALPSLWMLIGQQIAE